MQTHLIVHTLRRPRDGETHDDPLLNEICYVKAIVGAGAAGLVAAREFRRAGHSVAVYEQQKDIGGVWVLDSGDPDDPISPSLDNSVHTSMYDGLRVNLPRELMGFSDFPFIPEFMQV